MTNSVPDILKQLDDLNKQSGIDVFIPSLQRTVKFKALTLLQQKELLKSSIEETLTKLTFIVSFYNIIRDNILDTIDINKLYVFDRTAIALALRTASLDNKYSIDDNIIDLTNVVANIQTINVLPTVLNSTINYQNLSIDLEVPHLDVDKDISNTILTKIKTVKPDDIKTVVSELFIHEILKYIKNVTFKSDTGDSTINFNSLNVENKLAIAGKFPTTVTTQILEFIKAYRDFENQYTRVDETNIEVDGSFFAI